MHKTRFNIRVQFLTGGKMFHNGTNEKDVVCGMTVDTKTAISKEYGGKTYYFCCNDCKKQFEANPDKYTPGSKAHSHGGGCC